MINIDSPSDVNAYMHYILTSVQLLNKMFIAVHQD